MDWVQKDEELARNLLKSANQQRDIFFNQVQSQPEKALASCHRYVLALTQPFAMFGIFNDKELNQKLFDLGKKSAPKITANQPLASKIVAGVSTLYDIGGHTRCLDLVIKGVKDYTWDIVESAYDGSSREKAKSILQNLPETTTLTTVSWKQSWIKQAQNITLAIVESRASQLLLMVHPDDLVWPIVMGMLSKVFPLLKTHFFDHADHRFSLGRNLCHNYICFREFSLQQAKDAGAERRFVIPLAASTEVFNKKSDISPDEKLPQKFTFGASYSHKIMCDTELTYFELIAKGLRQNPDFAHIQMTTLSDSDKERIKRIFRRYSISLDRLLIIPNTPNWDTYIHLCHAILSSYPLGGGVAMLDLAQAGKPFLSFAPKKHLGWQALTDCPEAKKWFCETEEEWLEKLNLLLRNQENGPKQCQAIQQFHSKDNIVQKWNDFFVGKLLPQEGFSCTEIQDIRAFQGISLSTYLEYSWLYDWLNHPFSKAPWLTKIYLLQQVSSEVLGGFFKETLLKKTIVGRASRSLRKRFRKLRKTSYPPIRLFIKKNFEFIYQALGFNGPSKFLSRIKFFNILVTTAKKYALENSLEITEVLSAVPLQIATPRFYNTPPNLTLPSHPVEMPSHDIIHLKNAIVFGNSQLILTSDKKAIYDELNDHKALIPKSFAVMDYHQHGLDLLIQFQKCIEEAVHLCTDFGHNYFHWLIEAAPRLLGIEKDRRYQHLPLLIDGNLPKQVLEALKALVGENRELIVLESHKAYHVKKLVYPTPVNFIREPRGNRCSLEKDTWIRPESISYIRRKFYSIYNITPNPNRRFFVFRTSSVRSAKNLDEVKSLAASFGYEVLDTSNMSFKEQVELFAQASHILFQSGAAFTNIVFAPVTCKVTVTFGKSENCNYSIFQFVADHIGIDMRYLACESDPLSHWLSWHRTYTIDLKELKLALEQMNKP